MEITLTISKSAVMTEVAQTTSYTGDKMVGDEGAYDRISTVDENEPELRRFWNESRAEVAQTFKTLLKGEGMNAADADQYDLILDVSEAFDPALLPGMELGLFSYFVQNIVGKWYVYTNKGEAGAYSDRGAVLLGEVREKAFYKKKPEPPTYDD